MTNQRYARKFSQVLARQSLAAAAGAHGCDDVGRRLRGAHRHTGARAIAASGDPVENRPVGVARPLEGELGLEILVALLIEYRRSSTIGPPGGRESGLEKKQRIRRLRIGSSAQVEYLQSPQFCAADSLVEKKAGGGHFLAFVVRGRQMVFNGIRRLDQHTGGQPTVG